MIIVFNDELHHMMLDDMIIKLFENSVVIISCGITSKYKYYSDKLIFDDDDNDKDDNITPEMARPAVVLACVPDS